MLRAMFEEFRGYLADEGFEVTSQPGAQGFVWRIRKRNRLRGTLEYSNDHPGTLAQPKAGTTLLLLGHVEDRLARDAVAKGAMVVDLAERRRWGSTEAGEEAVLFLSRYGLRFNRE